MPLLLDTHVWLWSQLAPENLGALARERILDPAESIFIATISTLEVARFVAGGRVVLAGTVGDWVERSVDLLRCATVELTHELAIEAHVLPEPFHRDPVDRILVASARRHALTLLTADRRILGYPHVDSQHARR